MLSLIMFIAFTLLGWFYAYKAWTVKESYPYRYSESGDKQLDSHAALLFSIILGWNAVGSKIFDWFYRVIPDQGSVDGQLYLACASIAVVGFLWIAAPMFLPLLFTDEDEDGNMFFRNIFTKRS